MISESIGGVAFQFLNLLAMHIVINVVGLLFVEAEILRAGDAQLLNDLKEGVIIMDQESGLVLFVNKAAKKFNFIIPKKRHIDDDHHSDDCSFD